jgi:hypothetical protein
MNGLSSILCACLSLVAADNDGSPLGPVDLPAYQAALKSDETQPAARVTFLDLWKRPNEFRGRRVQVEGKVVLRFRQDAVAEFPALEETWLVLNGDNLVCCVFPQVPGRKPTPANARVRFTGTFLKLVRYPGGDVERLAPLIVGPKPPDLIGRAPANVPRFAYHWLDWTIGLAIAGGVALTLALQHLRRVPTRQIDEFGPPPAFVSDSEAEDRP